MGRWPDKYVIGLTGNLAMGKSLVRRMLEHLGAYTIDAGGLAYQAMAPGAPGYKPIVETFGLWILNDEKRIDPARLDAVTFSHPDALRRRQAVTQPVVGRAIDTLIGRASHKVVVVEAVDLLEGAFAEAVDAIWVVNCAPEAQVQRLMKSSGITELEARKRISLQNPQQAKIDRAAVVFDNDHAADQTWKQVQAEWQKLMQTLGHTQPQEEEARTIAIERPAAPAPAPAPASDAPEAAPAAPAAPQAPAITEVTIKRGKPANAEDIAAFITAHTGQEISRMDVMMAFGQKSYLLAEGDGANVGLIGFQVENLITRVDEFMIKPEALLPPVITGLIEAVEAASKDLQSEIAFFFLPQDLPENVLAVFTGMDYVYRALEEIKTPAWRDAARDSQPEGTQIYAKKLRAERVLKPL